MSLKLADLTAATRWRERRASRAAPPAAEPAAARSALFRAMLDRLADSILLVAGNEQAELGSRRFLFANLAAREILPIEREEGTLASAIRAPAVLEAVETALWTGVEAIAPYPSGSARDRIWRAAALPLDPIEGTPGQLALLVLRDDTQTLRSERTRADFLANASHELRTPLASLTGFIETLRGAARDDAAARERFLAVMHGEAERMRLLIEDLLRLSQIERDEHLPPTGRVDLAGAVRETLDALAPLAAERGVQLVPSLPAPGRATILADEHQALRVIANLVENAIKYSSDGGQVGIRVRAPMEWSAATAPAGDSLARRSLLTPDFAPGATYAALSIADEGPGIARIHLPRLGERFYRVEGHNGGGRGGTGLGLAIVKHILRRHRGGLAVESVEGKGTIFTACFPMAAEVGG